MSTKKKILAGGCVLLVLAGVLGFLYVRHSGGRYVEAARMLHKRILKANNYARKDFNNRYDNPVLALVREHYAASPQDIADFCRHLIYAHSEKRFEEAYKEDVAVMYDLLARSMASGTVQLSLKCDGRILLLRNMLAHVGVPSRIVHGLYLLEDGQVSGHTFLEVRDAARGQWVVQDPYFDLGFVSRSTGRPADLLDLCTRDIAEFLPAPGSREESLAESGDFFARIYSVVIYDKREQGLPSVVLFNLHKLGVADMQEFFAAERFANLRHYLAAKWFDYASVGL